MKELDITTLRLFLAVYESKSIVRVAEREQLVPSAITKRLSRLERQIGTSLLHRTSRGMEATAAGHLFAERSRGIVNNAYQLYDEMQEFQNGPRGVITIAGSYAMTSGQMVDDVANFLQFVDHQKIRIRIERNSRLGIVQAVRDGRSALGVVWDVADTSGLQTFPYHQDQIAAVVSSTHEIAKEKSISYDQTAAFPTVRADVAKTTELMLERTRAITHITKNNQIEVPSFEAALRIAAQGKFACFAPIQIAKVYASALDLRIIPLTDAWANRLHVIACLDEATLSPAARALIQHLILSAQKNREIHNQ